MSIPIFLLFDNLFLVKIVVEGKWCGKRERKEFSGHWNHRPYTIETSATRTLVKPSPENWPWPFKFPTTGLSNPSLTEGCERLVHPFSRRLPSVPLCYIHSGLRRRTIKYRINEFTLWKRSYRLSRTFIGYLWVDLKPFFFVLFFFLSLVFDKGKVPC